MNRLLVVVALVLFLLDVVLILADSSQVKLETLLIPGGLAAWVAAEII